MSRNDVLVTYLVLNDRYPRSIHVVGVSHVYHYFVYTDVLYYVRIRCACERGRVIRTACPNEAIPVPGKRHCRNAIKTNDDKCTYGVP